MTLRDKSYSPWPARAYFACWWLLMVIGLVLVLGPWGTTYAVIGGIYGLVGAIAFGLGLRWRRR